MKRRQLEHTLQVKLVKWLTENAYPDSVWFAVGNGELRHVRVALRLKAEGVRPGVPDLCFLLPYGKTGWLELKARHGSLSDQQKGFAAKARKLGHLWGVVKTLNDAAIILKYWGVIKPNVPLPEEIKTPMNEDEGDEYAAEFEKRANDKVRRSDLADKIDLHIKLKGSQGFHLSDDDLREVVRALRGATSHPRGNDD